MEPLVPNEVQAPRNFQHTVLNYDTAAIRLLQILPQRSSAGLIQCVMRNATIDEEYTCLSYVWGQSILLSAIMINDERVFVRPNLYDFLKIACERYPTRRFWIDALCINQTDMRERNHQVQHMGQIFGHAKQVLSWFGIGSSIQALFAVINKRDESTSLPFGVQRVGVNFEAARKAFVDNEYWNRAWITQEIVLAKRVSLVAASTEIELRLLQQSLIGNESWAWDLFGNPPVGHNRFCEEIIMEGYDGFRNKSLIELLDHFSRKECAHPHDRIYSLLSICKRPSDLKANYALTAEELALQVLQSSPSFCFCAASIVAYSLGISTRYLALRYKSEQTHSPLIAIRAPQEIACTGVSWHSDCGVWESRPWQQLCLLSLCPKTRGHIFQDRDDSNTNVVYLRIWDGCLCTWIGTSAKKRDIVKGYRKYEYGHEHGSMRYVSQDSSTGALHGPTLGLSNNLVKTCTYCNCEIQTLESDSEGSCLACGYTRGFSFPESRTATGLTEISKNDGDHSEHNLIRGFGGEIMLDAPKWVISYDVLLGIIGYEVLRGPRLCDKGKLGQGVLSLLSDES